MNPMQSLQQQFDAEHALSPMSEPRPTYAGAIAGGLIVFVGMALIASLLGVIS